MKMKEVAYASILASVVLSFLLNRVSAVQILVFAPLKYAGVAPSYPRPFVVWGAWCTPGSSASIDPFIGDTILNAVGGVTFNGTAFSWFDTGWQNFIGVTQYGSVHADTYLWYLISAWGAGVRVILRVYDITGQVWSKIWGDGAPTLGISKTVDLGIN